MGSIGMPELLLIALVVIIVFGGGKLPQLGRGLGEGIRNFRDAMREGERSASDERDAGPGADKPTTKEEAPRTDGERQ